MRQRKRHPGAAWRGFTLIELLTVIGIIIIILAVTLPAMNYMMKGNSQKQAANTVTAYLASARATAINAKTPVALVFFEDPNNKNQSGVILLQQISDNGTVATFDGVPKRMFEYMPRGIKVTTLTGAGTMNLENPDPTLAPVRVVLFDQSGQMMLRSGLDVQVWNGGTAYVTGQVVKYQISSKWRYFQALKGQTNVTPTGNVGDTNWVEVPVNMDGTATSFSSPAVLVYDTKAYQNGVDQGADMNQWLQKNADLMVVNAYTGNVIR